MAESPDNTSITPAFITDAKGVVWDLVQTLTKGAQVTRNGTIQTATANVMLLFYLNHTVYQQTASSRWFYWSGTSWIGTTDPRVPVESPSGTSITTVGPAIVNSVGESWTLVNSASSGVQIAVNGAVQSETNNVSMLYYYNHLVYQQNVNGQWWSKAQASDAWADATDPRITVSLTGVTLSSTSFVGGSPSGTVVGAISVAVSGGSWSGTLSLSGTNASSFQIVGNNLVTNGVVAAGTYSVQVTATQAGAGNSPLTQSFGLVGTAPSGQLIQVPLGSYTGTWWGDTGSPYYTSYSQHFTTFVNALGGRSPTVVAMPGTPYPAPNPDGWPTQTTYNINNWPSVVPKTVAPMINFWYVDATGQPIYQQHVAGTLYAGQNVDYWIKQTLQGYATAGIKKIYLRPAWEWNQNFQGQGIPSGQLSQYLGAMQKFYQTAHAWGQAAGVTVRVMWNPACNGQPANAWNVADQFPVGSVDVISADFYAWGNCLASYDSSDPRAWSLPALIRLCQKYNLPFGFCELGDGNYNGQDPTITWLPDLVKYIGSLSKLSPPVPVEIMTLWDIQTIEWTPPQVNKATEIAGWKAAMGTGGSLMTMPV